MSRDLVVNRRRDIGQWLEGKAQPISLLIEMISQEKEMDNAQKTALIILEIASEYLSS